MYSVNAQTEPYAKVGKEGKDYPEAQRLFFFFFWFSFGWFLFHYMITEQEIEKKQKIS